MWKFRLTVKRTQERGNPHADDERDRAKTEREHAGQEKEDGNELDRDGDPEGRGGGESQEPFSSVNPSRPQNA